MIQVKAEDFLRVVVGVDPAITSGEDADETGIVVVASGPHQPDTCNIEHCTIHAYVLEDATLPRSSKSTPERWATRVVEAYDEWNAGIVVVEGNAGRELLKSVLHTIRPTMPVDIPNARFNKVTRAEPIVALYEQGRVHHIGDPASFALLEDQMTTWVPTGSRGRGSSSPDRMDALVWAISELDINSGVRKRRWEMEDGITPMGFDQTNHWSL